MSAVPTAPDGTPVADLLEELRELKARLAAYKADMQTIGHYCMARRWTADLRWQIRDIAERKRS